MSSLTHIGTSLIARLRRLYNQRCRYEFPDVALGWEKVSGPVLVAPADGSLFDPCVIFNNNESYDMYVSDRSNGSIALSQSDDGIAWSSPRKVYSGSGVTSWDSTVNRACVKHVGDTVMMWYTGQCNGKSSIGVAHSKDGVHFKRVSTNPVICANEGYEGVSVMNPCVVIDDDGTYKMWYAAGSDFEPNLICGAVSEDGIIWYKKGPALCPGSEEYDKARVGACDVVTLGGNNLAMFYIGYQNIDVARICLALSNDGGITWRRSSLNPIIGPTAHAWDSDAVYKPAAVLKGSSIMLWYNGRQGNLERIGMAYGNLMN